MSGAVCNWPLMTIGDICEFKYGKSLSAGVRSGGTVPVYGSNGVVGGHDVPLTAGETIVVGRKGSYGEANFSLTPCWPIDTTYFIDKTATDADLRWLSYRLTAAGLNQMNRAAAVPGLNREDAYRVTVLLPPLLEQRRIAAILDQAETLRTQRRAALVQLDSLTQSIFFDLFGDPATFDRPWQKVELALVADIVTGYPFRSEEYVETGDRVRLCRGANVMPGRLDWSDLACWPKAKTGDVEPFQLRE